MNMVTKFLYCGVHGNWASPCFHLSMWPNKLWEKVIMDPVNFFLWEMAQSFGSTFSYQNSLVQVRSSELFCSDQSSLNLKIWIVHGLIFAQNRVGLITSRNFMSKIRYFLGRVKSKLMTYGCKCQFEIKLSMEVFYICPLFF